MGTGRLKRAIWIQANAKGRFGLDQSKGVPWMQIIAKGRFGFGRTRETLWVQTSLKGCFWIRAGKKERFGHGQTLKDACEGAHWKRKTLKAPLLSNTETYEWYFADPPSVQIVHCTLGRCFGTVCTGWRFLMSVTWQYAAFCLTALQQINTSDRNKAHFSNSALPFSIGVREVQPKMIRAYKQRL